MVGLPAGCGWVRNVRVCKGDYVVVYSSSGFTDKGTVVDARGNYLVINKGYKPMVIRKSRIVGLIVEPRCPPEYYDP